MMASKKGKYLGAVIEFRLPGYFVYGCVTEENVQHGDTILMFAPKFKTQLTSPENLYAAPVRCKIQFGARYAKSKRFSDILGIIDHLDCNQLDTGDPRFRLSLAGISDGKKWQIIRGNQRQVVPYLTEETALLSDSGIPGIEYIRKYYDDDLYPWSAELTSRGATNFDPVNFERKMQRKLKGILPSSLH